MQARKHYKQVNWQDGMKINKAHFIDLENHITSCDAEIRGTMLDRFSYGLLPLLNERPNLQMDASIDEQKNLKVSVTRCFAVSIDGYRIDIDDFPVTSGFALSDMEERDIYIGISVNPYERVPSGMADASESPVRQPFVTPEYRLHVIPASVNLASGLDAAIMPIGKLTIGVEKPEIDSSYIPPCVSVRSHPDLKEFYQSVYQHMIALERNIVELISEIKQKTTTNVLISIISQVADSIMYYLNGAISQYKWQIETKPPVVLISSIVSLARSLKNAFDTGTPEEREKFLNYLSDHFDIHPAQFKQLLEATIGIDYHHTEIKQSVEKAEEFMNVISELVNELKKMEFIVGEKRKKRIDIIIK